MKDGIAPKRCVGCESFGAWICDDCRHQVAWVGVQACYLCGVQVEDGRTCGKCRSSSNLTALLVACHFEHGPIRSALHKFKYGGSRELGRILAGTLATVVPRNLAEDSWIIVPIPGHKKRTSGRGYNPAHLLAKDLAKVLGYKMVNGLEKHIATQPQVEGSRLERLKKVRYSMRTATKLPTKRVILVDDVATTGATLEEGARALREAGIKQVIGLVVARSEI